jgi:hypothetical protein
VRIDHIYVYGRNQYLSYSYGLSCGPIEGETGSPLCGSFSGLNCRLGFMVNRIRIHLVRADEWVSNSSLGKDSDKPGSAGKPDP